MHVRLCPQCGYQLARKARRCHWCKSPVKKRTAFFICILVLLIFLVLVIWPKAIDNAIILLSPEPNHPQVVKVIKTGPPVKTSNGDFSTVYVRGQVVNLGNPKTIPNPSHPQVVKVFKTNSPVNISRGNVSTVYVKGQFVNLRESPSLTSHTIGKLKVGQRLTQVDRLGNWLQVLESGAEDKPGWVHASLIGKIPPPRSSKAPSEQKAFKMFRKSFDRYNAQIKRLKGMDFFNNVEYMNQGVIQVTATDILLSAPKRYKEKYLLTLMGMWLKVRNTTLPAAVRIVDKNGHLRLEEKQG